MKQLTLKDLYNEIEEAEVIIIDYDTSLKAHSASTVEPMISDEDFEALLNDINGTRTIHTPLILIDDWILDGRNRNKSAKMSKVNMPVKILKQHYSKSVLEEYVRSIHMRRNKSKDQLAIQAFQYKQTVANVTWSTAASRFGISERKVKSINTIMNKLNDSNRGDDFESILEYIKNNKPVPSFNMAGGFSWLNKPAKTLNSVITQLNETTTMPTDGDIDFTNYDLNGEERKKQENALLQLKEKETTMVEKVAKLEKELEIALAKIDELTNSEN